MYMYIHTGGFKGGRALGANASPAVSEIGEQKVKFAPFLKYKEILATFMQASLF